MSASPIHSVNLTNCDREPIHLLGRVQPFGFLIAASSADWLVERVSQNISNWIDAPPASLLGKPLDSIVSGDVVHALRGHLQGAVMGDTIARIFGLKLVKDTPFDVAVHLVEDSAIIECEPTIDDNSLNTAATVRGMMARLHQTDSDRAFYRVAAREMRALTGFDRVMVYRFDQDGSGEVIAESARAGLESYLGLHYPASDIPQQARVLYERNWLRIIPDVNAVPVPIEPELGRQGRPIDLSMSILRSVSSIHLEYLRNMGVQASMSVSILRQNRLWGLFACHHYAPHLVGFGRRTAAELFGQMFSLLMENREREAEVAYELRGQKIHQRIITVMASEGQQFDSIVTHLDDIADLLECDGIGLWMSDRGILKGRTPDDVQFAQLVEYLKHQDIVDIHAQHHIAAEYPPGKEFADRACGMLVVPLSRPARDYLVFFREEAARYVNWAGDPTKPVTVGPLGDRLTPRKSFALWKETVKGQSRSWKAVERRIVENLRVSLLEVILRLTDLTVEERKRGQQRQDLLIAELNHRVRNILNLIRGVITQSKDAAHTVESFTGVVGGRIQALARAHDLITADQWGPASFQALINAEAGAYLGGKAERVRIEGPDALISPEAFTTIALVIHEMITNSAKYGALSDNRGRVEIETGFDRLERFRIAWSEHGGPPVKAPIRRGFGSTVIEQSILHDLKGDSQIEYLVSGLRAEFLIPAAYASASTAAIVRHDNVAKTEPSGISALCPDDVLLVEDNMIIALDAEEMLRELGVKSIRVASGVAAALRLIDERSPDFALLDVHLGEETSFEVASHLLKLDIPFAFATGYGEQAAFPAEYAQIKKLRKPYSAESLQTLFSSSA
jgi:light-regulated signal transduction histidine kinase (bacteriophytochrome)/CheY-like chemotaxis protein